nr:sugar ABC transporter substrate-binding protein [Serratia marcescens]
MFTGRIDQADPMKQVYYNEGWSGPNKYTFEVYQLENGRYRALARKWNGKINKVQQETQYLSDTREGLKHQDYPRTRQVKIFLNSDFWEKGND